MEKGGKESARRTRGSDFTGGGVKWPDGITTDSECPCLWGEVSALVCALIPVLERARLSSMQLTEASQRS